MINPVAFTIFGIDVMWYGILVTLGIYLGVLSVSKLADGSRGITSDDILDLCLIMIPVAVLTTRLWFVIFYDLEYYLQNPIQILNFREGGLAIHGGIIGGIIVVLLFSKKKNIDFLYLFDILSPGLALGQAIGRWGNYTNHEAHGGPTDLPWGIMVDGVKVHPTFLYESIITFSLFLYLYFYLSKNKKFDGQMCSIYLIGYGIARLLIEPLRTDNLMVGDLRIARIISLIFVIIGVGIYFYGKKNKKLPTLNKNNKKIIKNK